MPERDDWLLTPSFWFSSFACIFFVAADTDFSKVQWYCSVQHQRAHWKDHKAACNDAFQADQYTLHKQEFDRIIQTYKLNTEETSNEIAEFLTQQRGDDSSAAVSAPEFAGKFGLKVEEAVVFLEWIKVGVKFKETAIDTAKQSGFSK